MNVLKVIIWCDVCGIITKHEVNKKENKPLSRFQVKVKCLTCKTWYLTYQSEEEFLSWKKYERRNYV